MTSDKRCWNTLLSRIRAPRFDLFAKILTWQTSCIEAFVLGIFAFTPAYEDREIQIEWEKERQRASDRFLTQSVAAKLSCDTENTSTVPFVEASWNVMAHAQKPDFVFRRNGRVHLNRRGCHFSRLLAAEVCASAVVMLDTPCSEMV